MNKIFSKEEHKKAYINSNNNWEKVELLCLRVDTLHENGMKFVDACDTALSEQQRFKEETK